MYTGKQKYDDNTLKNMKKARYAPPGRHLSLASDEYYEKVDAFMAEICRRLAEARLQADISIAELAKATGITTSAIYKYESTGRISMLTFAKVMFALQLEINVIPFFDGQISLGNEFENIVQDLSPEMQTKILNEVRSIVSLVK